MAAVQESQYEGHHFILEAYEAIEQEEQDYEGRQAGEES